MSVSEKSSAALVTSVPLSIQQSFFCAMDMGDETGAFGAKHVVACGWRLSGRVDLDVLQQALDDVVARHEILRTSVVRDPENPYQEVFPALPVRLTVSDIPAAPEDRDTRAEVFYNEIESAEYCVRELPHLRATLGRLADDDAMLALVVHHVAADGWSMRVLIRDLATRYAARLGYDVPDLPPVRQYREYVSEQQTALAAPNARRAREYWREELDGAEIATLRADRTVADDVPGVFTDLRYLIDEEITSGVLRVAKKTRSTAYMVLMAAYALLLREKNATDDVVAATFFASRSGTSFQNTVGPFLNFVPLRTNLSGCRTFTEVIELMRRTCLDAFTNEIPFLLISDEAPGLMAPAVVPGLEVACFEVLQFPGGLDGETLGGIEYAELRRRVITQPVACDIPNGVLWALDVLPSREIVSSLKFDTNRFDVAGMWGLVHDFTRLLKTLVAAPEAALN